MAIACHAVHAAVRLAAYAVGRYDEALLARERAHKAYLESGDRGLAAAAAIKIANVFVRRGEFPLVGGWMGTAERLLEQQPESVGHGLLTWMQGMFAYVVHRDLAAADRLADETIEIGRRLGDAEVHTLGLAIRAEVRARQGDVEAPRLIDEAMATALGGALSPWATCHVLCRTMILCQETGDFRRARQRTAAARESCTREGVTPISGDCRVHHAGLLNWQGEWAEAELEAETGCREVPGDLMHVGDDAWADLLRWHDKALRAQFAAHHEQEVHYTGDGFFVAFTSAADALLCAESIQRKLATHRRVSGFAPQVRIGVHVDEATMDSSNDYHGRGVHVAARVAAEAGAGGVLVSRQALDAARISSSRVVDLKGVTRPLELHRLRWD